MTNAPLITIYNVEGFKVDRDDDCLVFSIENIQRMEITRAEFEALIRAYQEAK